MKLIKLGDVEVLMYGTSKEMPIKRYNAFQKLLLMDSGIGSDMDSISRHFTKLHSYIANDMQQDAAKEAENLHYNFYAVLNNLDFRTNTFACLIASIAGEPCSDISEDGLKRTSERIVELNITVQDLDDAIDAVKKKLNEELAMYFPRIFSADDTLQFFAALKQQLALQALQELDEISVAQLEQLKTLDQYFLKLNRPQNFRGNDPDSVLVDMDIQFSQVCALMESEGGASIADASTFDFYARLSWHSQRAQPAGAP